MTSLIDTSTIDATKPSNDNPTLSSVRDNTANIKTALNTAKTEIETLQTDVSSLNAAMVYIGPWDASTGVFPSSAKKGYVYSVSVAGTVDGVSFDVTDRIDAITDNASTTTYTGNWYKEDFTDRVLSVNGQTGAVTITDITGNAATVTTNANLTGEVTSTGNSTTVSNSAVIAKVLTAFSAASGVVSASDSILSAIQKLVGNLALKLTANAAITAATKTKITYDANGLVTAGADATTADIADSTDKRYITDAQQIVLGNTSGTNTGDQDINGKQDVSAKDANNGYVGLTLFKINFKNAANTITSFFTNSNTAARTYAYQDRDYTVAGLDDFVRPVLHVRDEKATNTHAGGSSAGVNTRTLNTVVKNTITGASLSSNQITLPAGTYKVLFSAPCVAGGSNKAYLYNITDTSNLFIGSNEYAHNASIASSKSIGGGVFTLTSAKVIELRHYIVTALSIYGLGAGIPAGMNEVYAEVFIEKLA